MAEKSLPKKKIVPKVVPVIKERKISDGYTFPSNDNPVGDYTDNDDNDSNGLTVKISIPSLNDIQKEIYNQIQSNVTNIVEEILENISRDESISLEKLKENYLTPLKIIMDANQEQLDKTIPRKPRKNIDITRICMARTSSEVQCSRKKQRNADFCGSHATSQPFGRIDQPFIKPDKAPKKRGRPPKYPPKLNLTKTIVKDSALKYQGPDFDIDENDTSREKEDIVQVKFDITEIDGETRIIDENGNIYEPPTAEDTIYDVGDLKLLGKKMEDGAYLWF